MATNKISAPNIDASDLTNYPDGRIKDNAGSSDGTPVNRLVYGDLHEFFAKMMRLGEIAYNGLPDNETNGYQLVEALIAIAGKNDYINTLSSVSGVINIPAKLSILKTGEMLICKSAFDFAAETQIKGSGVLLLNVNVPSDFKTNDYIRLIRTNVGVDLIRLADGNNIDAIAAELAFLKSATLAEEYAGAVTNKATTPYNNQLAFFRRVCGLDSGTFLASTIRNGLLSKEDKAIIDGFVNPVKNTGWFSGMDVGDASQIGTNLPCSGDIVTANVYYAFGATEESSVRVTVANAMTGLNYYVRIHLESEGNIGMDDDCLVPVFKKETNTQFVVTIGAVRPSAQSLKIHLEVVQIS